jgi:hypothetical protein
LKSGARVPTCGSEPEVETGFPLNITCAIRYSSQIVDCVNELMPPAIC